MKKVIIWLDVEGKCRQIITPFRQGGKKETDFDNNWLRLVQHVTKSTNDHKGYYKFEVV